MDLLLKQSFCTEAVRCTGGNYLIILEKNVHCEFGVAMNKNVLALISNGDVEN